MFSRHVLIILFLDFLMMLIAYSLPQSSISLNPDCDPKSYDPSIEQESMIDSSSDSTIQDSIIFFTDLMNRDLDLGLKIDSFYIYQFY